MYKKSLIPQSTSLLLHLPKSFVGEHVRIVAVVEKTQECDLEKRRSQIAKTYSKYPKADLALLNFDREEANENG